MYFPIIGRVDVASLLIYHGASVDLLDEDNQTLLHLSCAGGHAGVVRLLLDAGATPQTFNSEGLNALHKAATCGLDARGECVAAILRARPDLANVRAGKDSQQIRTVGRACPFREVSYKIKNIFLQSYTNLTPLHLVAMTRLREAPDDRDVPDGDEAVDPGAPVKELVHAGAEVDAVSPDGDRDTPLSMAVRHLNAGAVLALLEAGANTEHEDAHGLTPLAMAVKNNPDP